MRNVTDPKHPFITSDQLFDNVTRYGRYLCHTVLYFQKFTKF